LGRSGFFVSGFGGGLPNPPLFFVFRVANRIRQFKTLINILIEEYIPAGSFSGPSPYFPRQAESLMFHRLYSEAEDHASGESGGDLAKKPK
jgi:hypothetical protein